MKKLYSAIALAAIAFGASAQSLYFKGAGEGLSWDTGVDLAVDLKDGAYTVEIASLTQFKVSANSSVAGWDGEEGFNAKALYAAGLGDKANLGKAMPAEINGGENNVTPWKGTYKIVIPADLSTITITTTTPEPTGFAKAYIRGNMNGWLNAGTEQSVIDQWEFTTTDGVKYWFNCEGATMIPAMTTFKIADLDWDKINYSAPMPPVEPWDEAEQWSYNGPVDSFLEADYTGTILLNLTEGPGKAAMVTFYPTIVEWGNDGVEGIIADENAAVEYFNLQGVRVANPENGLYIVRQGKKVSKMLVK